jgi:transcription elongation GreA/GreB family factor
LDLKIKLALHQHLEEILINRISQAKKALDDIIFSRDNESKSTAGDKYETGRAMMQQAQKQQEIQVQTSVNLLRHLSALRTEKVPTKIGLGSLVKTNQGLFYLSIGLGEIQYEDKLVHVISMASPLAQLLANKKKGEVFELRDRNYEILEVS